MKAIISEKYGTPDTLKLGVVATPTPQEEQVLVRVRASSVNHSNLVLLKGKPLLTRLVFGLTKPKYPIPGGDLSGVVEATGERVTQFQAGDEVYGDLSSSGWGAFAEYVVVEEKALFLKPRNLSHSEAAAVPMAATTALQAVRDRGRVKPGQEVMIYGASGGVGTFAIQIAKAAGAEVTAVVSTRNVEIARALGADHIIDYKKKKLEDHGRTYDLIVGVNGSQSVFTYKRMLKRNGVYILVGGNVGQLFRTMMLAPWQNIFGKKKFLSFIQKPNQKDLILMKELIEEGKVMPVIDKSYSLKEVPMALHYFAKGHSRGKVVITI